MAELEMNKENPSHEGIAPTQGNILTDRRKFLKTVSTVGSSGLLAAAATDSAAAAPTRDLDDIMDQFRTIKGTSGPRPAMRFLNAQSGVSGTLHKTGINLQGHEGDK